MNKIKEKIRAHFNKASRSYDQNCMIQNTVCEHMINLLQKYKKKFKHIADFACGTGESTRRLLQEMDYEKCYAIDFSKNLLMLAKQKLKDVEKINFIQADLDELLVGMTPLHFIFCNMGLQWSENLYRAIRFFHQYLIENGILLFSMPITDNFPEIKPPLKPILQSHESIIQIIMENNFLLLEYDIKTYSVRFNNQFELLKSLKNVGSNYNKSEHHYSQGLSKIKFNQIFTDPENIQLTYKIGIYLARKK